VTKAFYERGWRGINVEPMPDTFGRLQAARPRDINLQLAVDNVRGRRTYFSVDGGGGLSTGQPFLASAYTKAGRKVSEIEVEVDTLENICKTYVTQEIHFLLRSLCREEAADVWIVDDLSIGLAPEAWVEGTDDRPVGVHSRYCDPQSGREGVPPAAQSQFGGGEGARFC
jgi:hypothetical protein